MDVEIEEVYTVLGVTATEGGDGVYHIKGGDNTLIHTKCSYEANRFAFAYANGKLDGQTAERKRLKEFSQ
jgi:hypothetical protein